jgi:hypothetical protein
MADAKPGSAFAAAGPVYSNLAFTATILMRRRLLLIF